MPKPARRAPRRRESRPPVAVGHVVLRVPDPEAAAAFYERLGLRPVWCAPHLAILELRGGTHLLLFPGGRRARSDRAAPFDLMADDLADFRGRTSAAGLRPSQTRLERRSGHRFFSVVDPAGNRITIYSSHTDGRRV
ncbi:MAG: VOC family protein [Planctomycetes bacterium]|nr:VOC family protein [Planctomycetota bacterium]